MHMPEPDAAVIARRAEIINALRALTEPENVLADDHELKAFDCDGLTVYKQLPLIAVLPETTSEVSAILKYCHDNDVKIVPRGAGTGLSGGAFSLADAVTIVMTKFNRILEVDYANRCAVVQPGVTNLGITQAVQADGFYYAPDPSSQIACSIGGNVAENSGGVHCLKYGLTTNNILGVELVLMDGTVVRLGGKHLDSSGYDVLGVITGSEGLLGVFTEVTVRLLRSPEVVQAVLLGFESATEAGDCVAAIISAGIIPAGIEMMDKAIVHATEDFVHAGYPLDVEALVIVELDGPQAEVDDLISRVERLARDSGAKTVQVSTSDEERMRFWAGRKAAFPAIGRIAADYICMDGSIPRKHLSHVLSRMAEMSEHYGLGVANVFHAGDGNLHPLIMFDANDPDELRKAEEFGADILKLCVEVGGVLSGEHGIGIEKRDLMPEMFTETDMQQQQRLKCAFDPSGLLNPGKVYPTLHRCAELGFMHVHKGQVPFPDIPRF